MQPAKSGWQASMECDPWVEEMGNELGDLEGKLWVRTSVKPVPDALWPGVRCQKRAIGLGTDEIRANSDLVTSVRPSPKLRCGQARRYSRTFEF